MIAPCDVKAARFAVEHWHYSQSLPAGKLVKYGVWENERFIGCIVYSRGASDALGRPFGLDFTTCCELTRIALADHERPVTSYMAESVTMLTDNNPGLRAIVSFADPDRGHIGRIYQAANWIYTGTTQPGQSVRFEGKWIHDRNLRQSGFGTVSRGSRLTSEQKRALPRRVTPGKHRYVLPLDKQLRRRVLKLAQPYPPAVEGSTVIRSSHQTRGGGATPPDRSILTS